MIPSQHVLVVMAPLLVAGAPLLPLWLGLPRWARKSQEIGLEAGMKQWLPQ